MRDALDIINQAELKTIIPELMPYCFEHRRIMDLIESFPRQELLFLRGIYHRDSLVGVTCFGLLPTDTCGINTVLLLYVKQDCRQLGYAHLAIDSLQEYGAEIVLARDSEQIPSWFLKSELAEKIKDLI